MKAGKASGHSTPEWVVASLKWLMEQESNGSLPQSDIILIPFTFNQFQFNLYDIISKLSDSSKIVICAAGRSTVFDGERICYPGFFGDVLCIGKIVTFW